MLNLGTYQELTVVKRVQFGVYLAENGNTEERVLLPEKQVPEGTKIKFGDQLYMIPEEMPMLKGLKVLRPGLHLGTLKKNRFEPSHALALALGEKDVRHFVDYPSDSYEIKAYLNGQTLNYEGEKGWYLVHTDGFSIGWAKLAGSVLKNHYPKGLRIM